MENKTATTTIDITNEMTELSSIDDLSKEELFSKTFIVEITEHAAKGLGITRITGKVTFIPYVTTGDIVEIKIKKNRSKYMKAEAIRIVKPSAERIEPKCDIFTKCGGCWFQHITYKKELEIKKNTVENSLKVIAHLEPEILDPIPSPNREKYRNHIQIKSSIKKELGFFMPERIMVAPLPEDGCQIIPDEMNEFVKNLNKDKNKIIAHRNYRIRQNNENEVYIHGNDAIKAPKYIYDKVRKYTYRIGMNNFFQVNRYQIENWLDVILNYVGKGHNTIIDLYCGIGLISLPLSEIADKVIGIEINKNSIKDAIYSMEANGVENVEFVSKSAKRGMEEITQADVIVLDPTRAGCTKETVNEILRINPHKIVYASCDAATFSRDCRLLVDGGYELKQVQPVDMFPYTHHIEIVGLLCKK